MKMIELAATGRHTATVIFLHGLGDSGAGWAPACKSCLAQPHIKFLCPSAPDRAVTMNGGAVMPSWFDRKGLEWDSPVDESGLAESTHFIHSLIDGEAKLLGTSERVLLAGFSQGGALALHSALTYPNKLAAVAVLSSFVLKKNIKPTAANQAIPVFLGHGDHDELVHVSLASRSLEWLDEFNPNTSLTIYKSVGHTTNPQEMRELRDFIAKHLPII